MKQNLLCFLLMCLLAVGTVYAQNRQVSGKVTSSEDGSPIRGATVAEFGTSNATQTDENGNFSINVSAKGVIVISYVGYVTRRIDVEDRSIINTQLSRDPMELDEVLVVAYGTATRSTFTGSAATIGAESLENRSVSNISRALDGAAPGITSTLGSGQPGASASVRIRGFGSINAESDPLYVVDGVPFNGDLNSINPHDVETITVLKDASAATLYGSRAANGVVMITTKTGSNSDGKIDVNFKTNWGVSSRALKRYDVMNTQEYLETVFQLYKNDEIFVKGFPEEQAAINAVNRMKGTVDPIFGENEQYNPYDVPVDQLFDLSTGRLNPNAKLRWNENWMDEVMATSPFRQEYQFDASGGTERMNAFLSLNALEEEGLLKTTSFDRFAGRLNTELTPTDWFKATLSANLTRGNSNMLSLTGTSTSNVWYSAEQMAPIYPIWERDEQGEQVLGLDGNRVFDYGDNRAAGAQQNFNSIAVLYDDKYFDIINNTGARASIGFNTDDEKYGAYRGFSLTFNLGADHRDRSYTYYYNPYFGNAAGSGRLNKEWRKTYSYTFNQLLNWSRQFEDHSIDILLGHESYLYRFNLLSAQKTGFPFGGLYELGPGSTIADADSYEDNETLESYFSRLEYNFANRYYLSGSFRTDGSSRFHADHRWGNFWSVGGAWRVSEETFMLDYPWLNNLTLKASYGEQGNNTVGLYAWQSFYDLTWANANNSGAIVETIENQAVSWEKNQAFNVGLEGRMLNNRLNVGFDWYTRKTTDMLLNRPMAMSMGFPDGVNDNIGDMKNYGFDLTLGYDFIQQENLRWNVTAMASKVNNEVLRLTEGQNEIISSSTIIRVGEPVNSFYMARSAGVDPATGDQLYWVYDEASDQANYSAHYVSSDKSKAAASRVVLGSRIPDLSGSLSTNLQLGNLDFSALTTYSIGGRIYDQVGYSYMNPLYIGNNRSRDALRAWRQPGDITDVPRLQKELTHTLNDRALVDASYFAIRSISVGYTFDLLAMGLRGIRVFAQGDNIAIFSARQGLNPQHNFTGTTDYVYTPNRIISAGLNLKF